ncbi:MAG: class I SAM-dependent methyltransferase [Alphaproteobacteria bacterium]|nr:class I SAM-dependent methyltransferase [Alphaproteobacteria bacterium]
MKLTACRLCGCEHLSLFLDLGFAPPADAFITGDRLSEPETHYPLRVVRCDHCYFIQLDYVVPPDVLYTVDYPYESSMTKAGKAHFARFAETVAKRFDVPKGELAVDIGSNVGVLLSGFRDQGLRIQGVDPATNIAKIANAEGIPTIPQFFSADVARQIFYDQGPSRIITGTNVFAHIHDLTSLMQAVDVLLAKNGVFIVEAPYFVHLLEENEFDTIYHEHLSYISIKPLAAFFHKCGFELVAGELHGIHGGSIRLFICRQGAQPVDPSVGRFIAEEEEKNIYDLETLNQFAQRVRANRNALRHLLLSLKDQGKRIAGVSAPAKGMTLLNYCGLGNDMLEFVTEKSKLKIGRYTPGGHIPVKPDSALVEENIDVAILLAWNFKEEIMANLSEFRSRGGKFIVPVPVPELV